MMDFILNPTLWIMSTIFLGVLFAGMLIFYYLLFSKTHVKTEIKAWFSKTPIGIFFQDNKYCDFKPITMVNGVVYDKVYGPFIATTTYVDKRTKNIIIPFDVDMDGDRTSNVIDIVNEFKNITNNEKSIAKLREDISTGNVPNNRNIKNLSSFMTFGALKQLFLGAIPHNIKSKIEKMIAEKVDRYTNVDPMQAIIVFGAIFGIILVGIILVKTMG